jgi:ElaB/YqjD/DUF883 family membrane-anchored ribosome-binding protein
MQNRVVDELMSAARHSTPDGRDAEPDARDNSADVMQTIQNWMNPEQVKQLVVAHPGIALGTAAAIGVIFGWWIKRK